METKPDDDAVLVDFLSSLVDYAPTIPDELTEYYLSRSGFQCPDVRVLCKLRQTAPTKEKRDKQSKDKRFVLTAEDLSQALREYGVNIKRQEYFADNSTAGMSSSAKEKNEE